MSQVYFPAEWFPQSCIQITWPHSGTDWADVLDEVTSSYITLSKEILKREKLLVVIPHGYDINSHFTEEEQANLISAEIDSNDTWARDHGAISVFVNGKPVLLDFGFNGWGLKFAANYDNQIIGRLFEGSVFNESVSYQNHQNFILEGGSVESDGNGTILTTSICLSAPNRNQPMKKGEIEEYLKQSLGAERVLWLNYGYLAGDDTDSHVDTLARFCNETTIAYVKCDDVDDEHYSQLKAMEEELKTFVTKAGEKYNLVALPMADALFGDSGRLPATYANFIILNDAVIVPAYGSTKDQTACHLLQEVFPDREIVGIDSRPFIKQHGSLHCLTMQFPEGFL
ncbi:MAG: agmatine deiminase family protein [Fermentimonas sp.]|nr:agmatine deiminase family protein [Fermentimonas sp.]